MADSLPKNSKIVKHVLTGQTKVVKAGYAKNLLESPSWIEIDEKGKEVKKKSTAKKG